LNRFPRIGALQRRDLVFGLADVDAAALRLEVVLIARDAVGRPRCVPSLIVLQRENPPPGILDVLAVRMLLQKCLIGTQRVGGRRPLPVALGGVAGGQCRND